MGSSHGNRDANLARGSREVQPELQRAAREDGPRVLSILASKFGDLDLADDAVQDALVEAARTWPTRGVPNNPGGWLMTTARRRALDRVRSRTRRSRRLEVSGTEILERSHPADQGPARIVDSDSPTGADERLRLILLCCHPALDRESQVALTLRLVAGLTTSEISQAFLIPESTLAQRIVRAKRKIRTAKIPMTIPDHLDERLDSVLTVLYLVFNEGYLTSSNDHQLTRIDLIDEAVRLTRLVLALTPSSAETLGLLALELFHAARSGARLDQVGGLVLLENQDRSSWDWAQIQEANRLLTLAMEQLEPGHYQLQAIIAAHHANSPSANRTNWGSIAALYKQLEAMVPSPIVSLNRAVAVSMIEGPQAGLDLVEQLTGLDHYHRFWAVKGELHHRSGQPRQAAHALRKALGLAPGPVERNYLAHRLLEIEG